MLHNEKDKYLRYGLNFTPEELELRAKFTAWLPDKIIDCHAHSNLPEHVEQIPEVIRRHMISTFSSFSLEESEHIKEIFYPGKQIKTLRFANTFRGINHRKANTYLLESSKPSDRVALFGLPEDSEYTISTLAHKRVSALKMYYSYMEPAATTIYQCFSPKILEVAENLNIPIILHLPQIITVSKNDLLQVTRDFPRLRIVIAHLGSTKFLIPGLEDAYKDIARQTEIKLDTSLNPSAEVVELALRIFGHERIMFGSDEPLHLIRSRPYIHPQKGQRIITEYPYHWVDVNEHREYGHLAKGVTHCHWLSMNALKTAINSFPKSEQGLIKENVFYENAKKFFNF